MLVLSPRMSWVCFLVEESPPDGVENVELTGEVATGAGGPDHRELPEYLPIQEVYNQ